MLNSDEILKIIEESRDKIKKFGVKKIFFNLEFRFRGEIDG